MLDRLCHQFIEIQDRQGAQQATSTETLATAPEGNSTAYT